MLVSRGGENVKRNPRNLKKEKKLRKVYGQSQQARVRMALATYGGRVGVAAKGLKMHPARLKRILNSRKRNPLTKNERAKVEKRLLNTRKNYLFQIVIKGKAVDSYGDTRIKRISTEYFKENYPDDAQDELTQRTIEYGLNKQNPRTGENYLAEVTSLDYKAVRINKSGRVVRGRKEKGKTTKR